MKNFELIRLAKVSELARTVAGALLRETEAATLGGAPYCVALSGGRIAQSLFSELAEQDDESRLSRSSVHFFWADERCVPPDDAASNYRVARELLFVPLRIPDQHIHRIRGEALPESAAVEAEAEVCRIAARRSDGQPVLDLIFLGMGEDGHVASLFPNEPESVMTNSAVYRAVTATKPPPQRITLGYMAIAAALEVWVLASGAGKVTALRESLSPTGQTPLARVLKSRDFTRVFTDIHLD